MNKMKSDRKWRCLLQEGPSEDRASERRSQWREGTSLAQPQHSRRTTGLRNEGGGCERSWRHGVIRVFKSSPFIVWHVLWGWQRVPRGGQMSLPWFRRESTVLDCVLRGRATEAGLDVPGCRQRRGWLGEGTGWGWGCPDCHSLVATDRNGG